jgi:hypothetical protein
MNVKIQNNTGNVARNQQRLLLDFGSPSWRSIKNPIISLFEENNL